MSRKGRDSKSEKKRCAEDNEAREVVREREREEKSGVGRQWRVRWW